MEQDTAATRRGKAGIAVAGIGLGLAATGCALAFLLGAENVTLFCWGVGALMFVAGVLLRVFASNTGAARSE